MNNNKNVSGSVWLLRGVIVVMLLLLGFVVGRLISKPEEPEPGYTPIVVPTLIPTAAPTPASDGESDEVIFVPTAEPGSETPAPVAETETEEPAVEPTEEPIYVPTASPVPTKNPQDLAVEEFIGNESYTKVYAIAVGANMNETYAKGGITNLRAAGYNAYLFRNSDSETESHCLLIGYFTNYEDCERIMYQVRKLTVSGCVCKDAYIAHVRLPAEVKDKYSNYYWQ